MKSVFVILFLTLCTPLASGQNTENRQLEFDSIDLKIIEQAHAVLSDASDWHKQDDRKCDDDIRNESYSLFCALYKGSIDVAGDYIHRRPAMQVVRFTLEKYEDGRVVNHRLMDWNNHPDTTFEEIKTVFRESIEEVKRRLE